MKNASALLVFLAVLSLCSCARHTCTGQPFGSPKRIDASEGWRFAPDRDNQGLANNWQSVRFDDSGWATLDAGARWEDQGYRDLDEWGWYRKSVYVPAAWQSKDVWLKFVGVNDAYTLYINGEQAGYFGEANISYASRPTATKVTKNLKYGESNLIAVQVNDWGNSGGLWRSPVVLTTNEDEATNLFKPMAPTPYTPEGLGYELYWADEFDGEALDLDKWQPRGVGPRGIAFVSTEAITVRDGCLELAAMEKDGKLLLGAVGTHNTLMTTYGFFECRGQLQKSTGNWAAFWLQSPLISKGEDPGKFGTEIDVMEYFKASGADMVSHSLHWAYGPNQQSIGGLLSLREGVGEGFHTFAVEWTPEKYAFYVDGYKYHEVARAVSHIDQYMILSMEMPRNREAVKIAEFPDIFKVDYVRVYKKKQ